VLSPKSPKKIPKNVKGGFWPNAWELKDGLTGVGMGGGGKREARYGKKAIGPLGESGSKPEGQSPRLGGLEIEPGGA